MSDSPITPIEIPRIFKLEKQINEMKTEILALQGTINFIDQMLIPPNVDKTRSEIMKEIRYSKQLFRSLEKANSKLARIDEILNEPNSKLSRINEIINEE